MIQMTVDGLVLLIEEERAALNGYFYGLYTNTFALDKFTVLSDLDEVVDTGYTAVGRQNPSFTSAVLNGDDQGELNAPDITWTLDHDSGDYDIVGYFVATLATGGVLVFAEAAPTPFTVTAAGQTYTITPKKVMDELV